VKTLRSLVSGEDVDLRAARDRFRKLVEREEGVVRNAILVSVTVVKSNVQSAHADGQKGVTELSLGITELKTEVQATQTEGRAGVAELKLDIEAADKGVTNTLTGISDNAKTILTNTGRNLVAAEKMGDNFQSVLDEMNQARCDRKG